MMLLQCLWSPYPVQQVASVAQSAHVFERELFGAQPVYWSRAEHPELDIPRIELNELLAIAAIVLLRLPLVPEIVSATLRSAAITGGQHSFGDSRRVVPGHVAHLETGAPAPPRGRSC